MFDSWLMTFVFRVVNVGILGGIMWYLFKTRIFPEVVTSYTHQQDDRQRMQREQQDLVQSRQRLEHEVREQIQWIDRIKKNMVAWRDQERMRNEQVLKERELLQSVCDESDRKRSVRAAQQAAWVVTRDRVVRQIEQELRGRYASASHGRDYLNTLVDEMEKR